MDDIRPQKPKKTLRMQSSPPQAQTSPLLDLQPAGRSILPPERPKRLKYWLIGIFLAIVVLIAATAGIGYLWYKDSLGAKSSQTAPTRFVVEQGASSGQVAEDLEGKGLIKSGLAAQIYMRLQDTDIKAGEYLLAPNQTMVEIISWLNEGKVDNLELTVLPGQTVAQIKQAFVDYGFSQSEVDAAFAKQYKHSIFKGKPTDASLEGYIYPETYFLNSDSTVEEVLNDSFDEFAKQVKKYKLEPALQRQGFSLWQGVILASLVEKEVKSVEDRRQVSQVLQKRLNDKMRLDIDATYEYAAQLLGVAATPDLDSPYNTRVHKGLPPGPISNFTISALQAIANPASGNYLYYVTGDDGINRFSSTLQEHEAKVEQYCQKLCAAN